MSITVRPAGPLRGIAGTVAVALLLFGSRWASYIPVGPLFLTDALLFLALAHYTISSLQNRRKPPLDFVSGNTRFPVSLLIVAVYAAIRFVASTQHDLVAVRDVVPYLYIGVVGILAWTSVSHASDSQRAWTANVFTKALGFHALWFFIVSIVWKELPLALPAVSASQELHIFSPRNDVDTALAGVYAAALLARVLQSQTVRPIRTMLVFLFVWASILATGSRAGLLGSVLVTIFVLAWTRGSRVKRDTRLIFIAILPLLLGVTLLAVPQTIVGQKLLGSVGISQSTEIAEEGAGTQRARANAWQAVVDWTFETPSRAMLGGGFGNSFMHESGADFLLVNSGEVDETTPRSPHNYWVGSFARLGFVGVTGIVLTVLGHMIRSLKATRRRSRDAFDFLVTAIPIALVIPATLGVVLESPFGSVPFFWSVGALIASNRLSSPNRDGIFNDPQSSLTRNGLRRSSRFLTGRDSG